MAAFKYCEFLKTVSFPSTLKVICDEAFRMNYSLKEVTVPDSVTWMGDGAFRVCVSLVSFDPGAGVKKMESNLLQHDHKLTQVTVPDNITEIGESCFGQCYSLESLDLPDEVKKIGPNAFQECSSLREISCCDDIQFADWCFSSSPIQTVTITSSTNSDNGFTTKYLNGAAGWTLPGQTGHLTLLVIDTSDQMKMNAVGNDSGFVRLTEAST